MIPLILVRHGPTAWNADGRIQGQSDTPLSEAGRAAVRGWRLPPEPLAAPDDWAWVASPLARARETAALLFPPAALARLRLDAALAEMHWGAWEGRRLDELRAELGDDMADREACGLDFRPPGGESPRDVQARLRPWLSRVAAARRPTVALTHKGVIRALYALASGWDMTGKPPQAPRDARAHRFLLDSTGAPALDRLNIPLT